MTVARALREPLARVPALLPALPGAAYLLAALAAGFALASPEFLSPRNLSNIALQSAALIIVSLGMTLVFITHDLGVAWTLADRVAIMYLGRIVEVGTAEQVLTQPAHPYTRSLLEVAPEVGTRRTPRVLTGEPPDPAHIPDGCRFHPRCPLLRSGLDPATSALCTSEDPPLLLAPAGQSAACHATAGRASVGTTPPIDG